MTWNLWWRFGGNWRERQPGIIQTLRAAEPDLVGLQECWGEATTNQAEVLATALGLHPAFIRVGLPPEPEPVEEPSQAGTVMGLGLLSRWPIERFSAEPMPSAGRELAALVAGRRSTNPQFNQPVRAAGGCGPVRPADRPRALRSRPGGMPAQGRPHHPRRTGRDPAFGPLPGSGRPGVLRTDRRMDLHGRR